MQDAEEVTPEERQVRLKEADSIRKMLADTQAKTTRGEYAVCLGPFSGIGPTSTSL